MNSSDFLIFFLVLNSFLMWTTCTYPINCTYFPDDLSLNCFSLNLLTSHFYKHTGSIQDLPRLAWINCSDRPVLDGSVSLCLPRNASYSEPERKETWLHNWNSLFLGNSRISLAWTFPYDLRPTNGSVKLILWKDVDGGSSEDTSPSPKFMISKSGHTMPVELMWKWSRLTWSKEGFFSLFLIFIQKLSRSLYEFVCKVCYKNLKLVLCVKI